MRTPYTLWRTPLRLPPAPGLGQALGNQDVADVAAVDLEIPQKAAVAVCVAAFPRRPVQGDLVGLADQLQQAGLGL